MSDPMAMANAMMAFQRQAGEQIRACKEALATEGRAFSPEIEAEIATQAAAHPFPESYDPNATPSADLVAESEAVAKRAMEAVYPENGFPPDEPRLAPIEGVSIALYAIAAKTIGWSTDEQFIAKIVGALGIDPAAWTGVAQQWRDRIVPDIVLSTYYGQLFVAA